MVANQELNVLYAFDNNYAPYAGVSILSLLMNNESISKIRLFCVVDGVERDNIERIRKLVLSFGKKVFFIDSKDINVLLSKMGVPKYRGSYATHYRKFFHLFLPDDVHKLLYIDSDSIVSGSLSELIHKDFEGKCVMVSLDALGQKYKLLLGFAQDEIYFNAGVTYIDVDAWKEREYAKKLITHIINVRSKYCNPDQDLFNLVVRSDTLLIGPEYNFQPIHSAYSDKLYFRFYPSRGYYDPEQISNARQFPKIVHTYRYIGEFPWHNGNLHPNKELFDKYLEISPWKEIKKVNAKKKIIFTLEKVLYKILPQKIFLFIFERTLYWTFRVKNERLKRK